jgi:hypothetical protein
MKKRNLFTKKKRNLFTKYRWGKVGNYSPSASEERAVGPTAVDGGA